MKKIILVVFIGLFSFSLTADSLNLVEIQKKEKKRRKKNVKSKYVLNNDKIVEFSLKKSKTFVEADVAATSTVTKTSRKSLPDEKDTEKYWRGRLNVLNNSIENLKKRISDSQSKLNRESSNFLIASTPSLQQQIKNNIDILTKQITKLKSDLKRRESDREAFFTEARKSGVLPGWLR